MNDRVRYRYLLTPTGAGTAVLAVPGTALALVIQQRSLVAVTLGALLALAVNAVAARRVVGLMTVELRGPKLVTAGSGHRLRVDLLGRPSTVCAVDVDGGLRPWYAAGLPAAGEIDMDAGGRGVRHRLVTRVRSATPLGLVSCMRIEAVAPVAPLHVQPRREPVTIPARSAIDARADAYRGDDPVGVRPYAPGDPPRDVHWPSVARTGTMLVRDRKPSAAGIELDVVVDIEADEPVETVDSVLGWTGSALDQLLAQGFHIRLVTMEATPVAEGSGDAGDGGSITVGLISNPTEVGLRLARAIPGRPDRLDELVGSGNRLVISPEGLTWQPSG